MLSVYHNKPGIDIGNSIYVTGSEQAKALLIINAFFITSSSNSVSKSNKVMLNNLGTSDHSAKSPGLQDRLSKTVKRVVHRMLLRLMMLLAQWKNLKLVNY